MQKSRDWQLGMSKRQYYHDAFAGRGSLHLGRGISLIQRRRDQKKETRSVVPAQPVHRAQPWKGFRYYVPGGRQRLVAGAKVLGQITGVGNGFRKSQLRISARVLASC
jgi:hypothetical protein